MEMLSWVLSVIFILVLARLIWLMVANPYLDGVDETLITMVAKETSRGDHGNGKYRVRKLRRLYGKKVQEAVQARIDSNYYKEQLNPRGGVNQGSCNFAEVDRKKAKKMRDEGDWFGANYYDPSYPRKEPMKKEPENVIGYVVGSDGVVKDLHGNILYDTFNANQEKKKVSLVDHPPHYTSGDVEVIDIIKQALEGHDGVLAFDLGNTIKYILRAGKKDDISQELNKALWYLNHAIGQLRKEEETK